MNQLTMFQIQHWCKINPLPMWCHKNEEYRVIKGVMTRRYLKVFLLLAPHADRKIDCSFCMDYLARCPLPVPLSPRPALPSSAPTSLSRWRTSVDPARRSSSISPSPARCSSPQGSACDRLGHTSWPQWQQKWNKPLCFVKKQWS